MSPVAAKRQKRKKLKPRLSFGSSTGATANLPSNMEANLPELVAMLKMQEQDHGDEPRCEASGCAAGWSAQKPSPKDNVFVYPGTTQSTPNSAQSSPKSTTLMDGVEVGDRAVEHQPLTEADVTDIVSHLRGVLQEYGPSQEEDLVKELEPEKARRVLAEHDTITSFLEHHPGFRQLHEELHSFIYYEDPNDDCYYTASSTVPLTDLCDGLSTRVLGAKNAGELADSDRGYRSGRTSSCSSLSYETAMEDVEEHEKEVKARKRDCKDRWSQTPSRPRCRSQGLQAVVRTRNAEIQTQGWDPEKITELELILKKRDTEISELHGKLESIQEDTAREMQELRLTIERLRDELVEAAALQDEESQESTSNSYTTEEEEEIDEKKEEETDEGVEEKNNPEEVATTTVQSEDKEAEEGWPQECPPADVRQKSPPARTEPKEELHELAIEPRPKQKPLVEEVTMTGRPQVPEFYELHWRMEQAAASCSSRVGSPTKSKTEQQLVKIVQMIKNKLPNYTEQEIRRNVDYVRKAQGGFSRMTFNSIVALVSSHIKNNPR